MTVKINGAQLKTFLDDSEYWGTKIWDDVSVSINGGEQTEDLIPENVNDTDVIEFLSGYVWNEDGGVGSTQLDTFIRKWQKQQNRVSLLVVIDATKVDEVKASLKALGGRVRC